MSALPEKPLVFPWHHPTLDEDAQAFLVRHGQHWAKGRVEASLTLEDGVWDHPLTQAADTRLKTGGLARLGRAGLVAWEPQDNRVGIPYLYGPAPLNPHTGRALTSVRAVATTAGIDAWAAALAERAGSTLGPSGGCAFVEALRAHAAPKTWVSTRQSGWMAKTEVRWQALKGIRRRQAAREAETDLVRRVEGGLGGLEGDHPARVMRLVACGARDEHEWVTLDALLAEKLPVAFGLGGRPEARVAWQAGRLSAAGFSLLLPLPLTRAAMGSVQDWAEVLTEIGPEGHPVGWADIPRDAVRGLPAAAWARLGLDSWAQAARQALSRGRAGSLRRLWAMGSWSDGERLEAIGWVALPTRFATPLVAALLTPSAPGLARLLLEHGANPQDPCGPALREVLDHAGLGREGRDAFLRVLDEAGADWGWADAQGRTARERLIQLTTGTATPDPSLLAWAARLDAREMAQALPEARPRASTPRL